MRYAAASHQGATCHVSCTDTLCFHFFSFFLYSGQLIFKRSSLFPLLSNFSYWPLTVHPSLSENCERFCPASRCRWLFLSPVLPPPPPPSVFFPEPERCGKKRLTSCWQRAESGAEAKKTVQTDLSMPLVISFNIIKSFYSFRSSRGAAAPRWRTLSRRFQPRLVLALPTRLPDDDDDDDGDGAAAKRAQLLCSIRVTCCCWRRPTCSQVGLMDLSQNTKI